MIPESLVPDSAKDVSRTLGIRVLYKGSQIKCYLTEVAA